MATAVKIAVFEYERGWGSKIDDWMVCESITKALEFKKEFNAKNNKDIVPEWYMMCEGEPVPIELNDEQYELLKIEGKEWLSYLKSI